MTATARAHQDWGRAWFNVAVRLRAKGDSERAIAAYRLAIERDPTMAVAREQLGKLLYRERREVEAAEVYRQWIQSNSLHPIAAHMAAATGSAAIPARASDEFVRAVFDAAAQDYDAALDHLDYQAPRLLHECALQALGPTLDGFKVLDLGCGTGLCGVLFRSIASRIVGVDLSPAMLTEARTRAVYDDLQCKELTAYLDACSEQFDVILAADVFCYFGDLTVALTGCAQTLRPGGWLLFTVEHMTGGLAPGGFALQEHGRYSHTMEHVSSAITIAQLEQVDFRKAALRFERGAPVEGLTIVARAPSLASTRAASSAPLNPSKP